MNLTKSIVAEQASTPNKSCHGPTIFYVIVTENLGCHKLCAQCYRKYSTDHHKEPRISVRWTFLDHNLQDANDIVTGDETWIFCINAETRLSFGNNKEIKNAVQLSSRELLYRGVKETNWALWNILDVPALMCKCKVGLYVIQYVNITGFFEYNFSYNQTTLPA